MKLRFSFYQVVSRGSILFSSLLILACLAYHFMARLLPFLDALSIVVPWLILMNFLLLLCFLPLRKKRGIFFPVLALGLSIFSFGTIPEFRSSLEMNSDIGFHIMTYNARSFGDSRYMKPNDRGDQIVDFIQKNSPDILCFQEFSRLRIKELKQYPFKFMTPAHDGKSTQIILSKFPIVGQGEINFPGSGNNCLYADVRREQDTIRVYNIHLQSYNIGSRRFFVRNFGFNFLKRLRFVSKKHIEQARLVKEHQAQSPYPAIICGDFNATAFSNTYKTLKSGMKDSFRKEGKGWGTTFYLSGSYPYRIDYVLADEHFEILGHRTFNVRLSDHLPVMATLKSAKQ